MEKNKEESVYRPTYSPKGFLIEYPKMNVQYWIYIISRFLAFVIDLGIVIILWAILYYVVFKGSLYLPLIIPLLYFIIYSTLVPMITKGRTIGLSIARLRIVHKSAFYTSSVNWYFRGICVGLYALPVIGWLLNITAFLSAFLTRGITLIGLISQTIVISQKAYLKLQAMENEYVEELNLSTPQAKIKEEDK